MAAVSLVAALDAVTAARPWATSDSSVDSTISALHKHLIDRQNLISECDHRMEIGDYGAAVAIGAAWPSNLDPEACIGFNDRLTLLMRQRSIEATKWTQAAVGHHKKALDAFAKDVSAELTRFKWDYDAVLGEIKEAETLVELERKKLGLKSGPKG